MGAVHDALTMVRPSFFIVGAPKCGTTALSHFLRQHPALHLQAKEVYWFGTDLEIRGRPASEPEYLARVGASEGVTRTGECSVFYLHSARAASEIAGFDPDARIIAMVRDPVEMIHSLHAQLVYVCAEHITDFSEALAADEDRRRGLRRPRHGVIARSGYRAIGRYAEQLRRYHDGFGRDRVHVVVHDDLRADPAGTFAAVCGFLGVDPGVQPAFRTVNANKRSRSPALQRAIQHPPTVLRGVARALPSRGLRRRVAMTARRLNTSVERRAPMTVQLREELRAEFAPEVVALSELLGRDLTGWSRQR
jgi:hypothetical protein